MKGKFNNFWTCPLSNQKLFIISMLCNFQHLMELFTNPMFVKLCVWIEMGMGMRMRMGVGVKDAPFPQVQVTCMLLLFLCEIMHSIWLYVQMQ